MLTGIAVFLLGVTYIVGIFIGLRGVDYYDRYTKRR